MTDVTVEAIAEDSTPSELTKGVDGFYSILLDTKHEIEGREFSTALGIKLAEIPEGLFKETHSGLRYALHSVKDGTITLPKIGFITRLKCVSIVIENDESIVSYVAVDAAGCARYGLNYVEHVQRHIPVDVDVISTNLPGDEFYISIELDAPTDEVTIEQPE